MPPQVLLLTGAPDPSSIDWETSHLLDDFTAPVARFAALPSSKEAVVSSLVSTGVSRYASWRSIGLDRLPLTTGESQGQEWLNGYQGNAMFLATSDLSFVSNIESNASQSQFNHGSGTESVEEVLSQFYEHSFAVHASPQIRDPLLAQEHNLSSTANGTSFDSNKTSFASTTDTPFANSPSEAALVRHSVPPVCQVSELKGMPSAKYLLSIEPQTMTVNLIVGVISVSAPRRIKTYRGADVELVELLVGDETKSGFGINFWFSFNSAPNNEGRTETDTRSILGNLRPQDIVLLKNVAVSSFRGRVHGQSLRNGMTKLHLLYRNRFDRTDIGGCYTSADLESGSDQQIVKTKRAREWVQRFVSPGIIQKAENGRVLVIKDDLPLDTQ